MPLDPNIALGVRAPQLADPLAQYSNMLAVQNAQRQGQIGDLQYQNALRTQQDDIATREAISGAGGDYGQAVNALLAKGLYKPAGAIAKTQQEMLKGKVDLDKAKADTLAKNLEIYGNSMATLLGNPDPENVGAVLSNLKASGIPLHAPVPTVLNQEALMKWVRSGAAASAHGLKALEAYQPKVEMVNLSGTVQPTNVNTLAGPVGPLAGAAPMQTTPKIPEGMIRDATGKLVFDPEYIKGKATIANAGAARQYTNLQNFLPASEEAQRDFMKSTRATYDQLKQVPVALQNIDEAKKLIPTAKGFMGPGGESLMTAASFLNNRLGTQIDVTGVKDATVLRTRIFNNIMDNLKKMDAQPSQQQQMIMQESLGKLGTDPNAMSEVLDSFGDILRGKVELHNKEVEGAVRRGVKFPYDPSITVSPKSTGQSFKVPLPNGREVTFQSKEKMDAFKREAGLP